MCITGKYIKDLMSKAGVSQSDLAREINVPRQSLNYVICGNRELSLTLAMKLEGYFSLPDGELLKMQAVEAVKQRKNSLREHLCKELVAKNAFWSYDITSYSTIPDDELIEKCFTILDIDDINLMFEIYPRKRLYKVWKERMAIQGEYLQMLNVMIAMYYFGIKEPEKFLARAEQQHINKILRDETGIDNQN